MSRTGGGGALRIATHSGTFHADEALACFMLRRLPKFKSAAVTRTRDPQVLSECDVVVDVGSVYDHAAMRYDHHQRGFSECFGHGFGTKLSSAGLIYKHYGKELIAVETGRAEASDEVALLYTQLYKNFVESIDAIDNGIDQFEAVVADDDARDAKRARLVMRYVNSTTLSSRIGNMNAAWNEDASGAVQDARFQQASEIAGSELLSKLSYLSDSWLPARAIVAAAFAERGSVHPSGKVMTLTRFAPWKEHLFDLEAEAKMEGFVLYVLYQDDRELKWRVACVPKELSAFGDRRSLPEPWRGLRGEAIDAAAGIKGCTFVHAGGFTGGHETYDGALQMAAKALE